MKLPLHKPPLFKRGRNVVVAVILLYFRVRPFCVVVSSSLELDCLDLNFRTKTDTALSTSLSLAQMGLPTSKTWHPWSLRHFYYPSRGLCCKWRYTLSVNTVPFRFCRIQIIRNLLDHIIRMRREKYLPTMGPWNVISVHPCTNRVTFFHSNSLPPHLPSSQT